MVLTSQKKGQAGMEMLAAGVIALVIAGFFLVMGLIMLDELLVNTADTLTTVVNESYTTVNGSITDRTCANTGACGMNAFTITNMTNGSGSLFVIAADNYTVSNSRTCTWNFVDAAFANVTINNTAINMTYTYKTSTGEACSSTNDTIVGLGSFGEYIDLIAIAIVIAIVITLIIVLMVKRVR